jgi:uridine nucleosidase
MYLVLDGTTVLPEPGAPERTDMSAVLAMYKALIAEPPKTAWLVATGEFRPDLGLFHQAHK